MKKIIRYAMGKYGERILIKTPTFEIFRDIILTLRDHTDLHIPYVEATPEHLATEWNQHEGDTYILIGHGVKSYYVFNEGHDVVRLNRDTEMHHKIFLDLYGVDIYDELFKALDRIESK